MSGRPCAICGAANAPFGFRYPGGRRAQPIGKGTLWVCGAHRAEGESRWRAATQPKQRRAAGTAAPAAPARQGQLL